MIDNTSTTPTHHLWCLLISNRIINDTPLLGELTSEGLLKSLWSAPPLSASTSLTPPPDFATVTSASLPESLPVRYQASLKNWLKKHWNTDYAKVNFPMSDYLGRERWFCLSLISLTHTTQPLEEGNRVFTLSEVSNRVYLERLTARNASLLGFRHDLANQTFLLKALPELAEFSSPSDLITDLLEGIPLFLDFLDQRLGAPWTSVLPIKFNHDTDSIIEELNQWIRQDALFTNQWSIIRNELPQSLERGFSTLGLCWSLTQLARRLRHQHISGATSTSKMILTLNSASTLAHSVVGIDGTLLPSNPQLHITLTIDGCDLETMSKNWLSGIHWRGGYSTAQARDASTDQLSASWFGSWMNAAYLNRGVVLVQESEVSLIC